MEIMNFSPSAGHSLTHYFAVVESVNMSVRVCLDG